MGAHIPPPSRFITRPKLLSCSSSPSPFWGKKKKNNTNCTYPRNTTQHLFGNNKHERSLLSLLLFFLTFPPPPPSPPQVQYINTPKSILVEIQKYYGQPSRWFYAKLLQNIKALEGKQTLRRHYMLIVGPF